MIAKAKLLAWRAKAVVEDGDLSIRLAAEPNNIAGIRQAVAERAREFGLSREAVDDLRTVVSEICTNVVLHAYPAGAKERPLEVNLCKEEKGLRLKIRDRGRGIQPPRGDRPSGMRMGLLLVGALSSCFQLRSRRGHGTELSLLIPLPQTSG
jgi:serine/threonine-protein kinase RsbW/stage II sporulation protein AB (anti-sigma F factor)